MHLNRECTYPDLSNLFTLADVTSLIEAEHTRVKRNIQTFNQLILQSSEPDIKIVSHCTTPYECSFKDYCWKHVPTMSIFNIPRLNAKRKADLIYQNMVDIKHIPSSYPLSINERRFVDLYLNKTNEIDWTAIREELDSLSYPLYFLDFETDNPAIPRFDNTHPYDQFPFQYSCHVLRDNNSLEHYDFLHTDQTDPRHPIAQSLADCIRSVGTIIAYNAPFEKRVLTSLARQYPEMKQPLTSIARRLWDLLVIFRNHYFDPAFGGSNSIKNVLPVLCSDLSYDDLEIQEGNAAQLAWNQLIDLDEGPEKSTLIQSLKDYCKRDTYAMVEIFRYLKTATLQYKYFA